jgi:hypothetical protein
MKMWRFLLELKNTEENFNVKKCITKIGEMPKEAPEINFSKENQNEDDEGIDYEYY